MSGPGSDSPHVVVAGGGIAGLETLLALADLAGDRIRTTLVAPEPDFTYKPLIVEEPFSFQPAERHELHPIADELGASFMQQAVAGLKPAEHLIELSDGSTVAYEAAVICVGARNRPPFAGATTFQSAGESLELANLLTRREGAEMNRIAFVVPPGNSWPLPIYELALMTQRRAHDLGLQDIEFAIYTPEEAPLLVFGTVASDAVANLMQARGITVHAGVLVHEDDNGGLTMTPGDERIDASHVIALPVLEGLAIPGAPADDGGFLPIDEHARVKGAEHLYAAGDGTNFPIKQGGIGTQEADAAAEHVAARFGADIDPQPFHPVLRGMLLTGDESLSLEHSLTGGQGEGAASNDYLWWPPHKVSGRYLAAWLAGETAHPDPEPPTRTLDVEVALPKEWHHEPMALDPLAPPPD